MFIWVFAINVGKVALFYFFSIVWLATFLLSALCMHATQHNTPLPPSITNLHPSDLKSLSAYRSRSSTRSTLAFGHWRTLDHACVCVGLTYTEVNENESELGRKATPILPGKIYILDLDSIKLFGSTREYVVP